MKVIEVMKIGIKVLELLQKCCVNVSDVGYINLYDEYKAIVSSGCKVTYAVACLAEKYGISERKVYYLLKKFSEDCNIGAV